jgi:hypothetical protein
VVALQDDRLGQSLAMEALITFEVDPAEGVWTTAVYRHIYTELWPVKPHVGTI